MAALTLVPVVPCARGMGGAGAGGPLLLAFARACRGVLVAGRTACWPPSALPAGRRVSSVQSFQLASMAPYPSWARQINQTFTGQACLSDEVRRCKAHACVSVQPSCGMTQIIKSFSYSRKAKDAVSQTTLTRAPPYHPQQPQQFRAAGGGEGRPRQLPPCVRSAGGIGVWAPRSSNPCPLANGTRPCPCKAGVGCRQQRSRVYGVQGRQGGGSRPWHCLHTHCCPCPLHATPTTTTTRCLPLGVQEGRQAGLLPCLRTTGAGGGICVRHDPSHASPRPAHGLPTTLPPPGRLGTGLTQPPLGETGWAGPGRRGFRACKTCMITSSPRL